METVVHCYRHVQAPSFAVLTGSLILLGLGLGGIVRAEPGDNQLLSVDLTGGRAAGKSYSTAAPSRDGRYVAFDSFARNLVAEGSSGFINVYVRDRASGFTERVSVGIGGAEPNEDSQWPLISADGRFVAFTSWASNLVAADDNRLADVFVRDRIQGITRKASVVPGGAVPPCSAVLGGLSDDGRFLVFGCAGGIFLRDEVARTTTQIAPAGSTFHAIGGLSGDGRYVLYQSGDGSKLHLYDRITATTILLLHAPIDYVLSPAMSRDARWIAYIAGSAEVADDTNGIFDVYLLDRWTAEKRRVSVSETGQQASLESFGPLSVSDDGRHVSFNSYDNRLAPGANESPNLLVKDMQTGRVEFVAPALGGALSGDGTVLGFLTDKSLVPTDLNANAPTFWPGVDTYVHEVGRSSTVPATYSYNLRPRSIDFGDVRVSSSLKRGFNLVNVGSSVLPVNTVQILGTDRAQFRLQNYCPGALPPVQRCWIEVTFEPTSIGAKRARLHVVAGGIERNRSLSGVGVR